MDPNSIYMLKTTFFSQVRRIAKKFRKVDTQSERAQLIAELKVILETYKKYAAKLDKPGPPGKFEIKCAQLAAYIARSINIIARGYDAMQIKQFLDELEQRISKLEQLRAKDSKPRGKG